MQRSKENAKFVTPAGAALLEGYTRLPKTVQGTLSPSEGGLSPTRTDTATSDIATFRSLLPVLKGGLRTISVDNFTLLSTDGSLTGENNYSGTAVRGPKQLSGVFIAVQGSSPPRLVGTAICSEAINGHAAGTPMLVSFLTSEDRGTPPIPFGSQTVFMPLAPLSSYCEWIWAGILPRALIVCPNGAFLLESRHPRRTQEELHQNRAVLDNLVRRLSIVIDARQQHISSEGGTGFLCRGASNVLVVLDTMSDLHLVDALCRNLGTGPFHDSNVTVESASTFAISKGLLDVSSKRLASVSLSQVERAASTVFGGRKISVENQPLVEWNSSPVTVVAKIKIAVPGSTSSSVGGLGGGASSATDQKNRHVSLDIRDAVHGGHVSLRIVGVMAGGRDMTDLKPGEAPRAREIQAEKIIDTEIRKTISEGPQTGWKSQRELDEVSNKLGEAIRSQLSSAGIYVSEPKVILELRQEKSSVGRETRTPAGVPAVIPAYSTNVLSPRLGVILGILPSLGSTVRFVGWKTAESNGIPLY